MLGFDTVSRLELTMYGYDSKLSHELALFLYNIIYSNTYFRKRMSTANRLPGIIRYDVTKDTTKREIKSYGIFALFQIN